MRCTLCPRMCLADRQAGEIGYCGAGETVHVARAAPHFGEEPCISGTKGSGAVFFSGCALGCLFCQNAAISGGEHFGISVDQEGLHQTLYNLLQKDVHNLNLVTATPFLPALLPVLDALPPVPVIWNSSGYERPQTLEVLHGRQVVFLPDYKYADERLAEELSFAKDYPAIALNAIRTMIELAGPPVFDGEGMMTGGVLIRHLVLPGNLNNTRLVLDTFAREFRDKAGLSLMSQYTPPMIPYHLPKPMHRALTQREYDKAVDYAMALGLEDIYIQSLDAADPAQTPAFDGTGVHENIDKKNPYC